MFSPLSPDLGRFRSLTRVAVAAAVLTAACSCSKPPEPPPAPEPTPTPTPRPATPTPTPIPTPSLPPTPTPVVHRYAPEGIYFVTDDISVRLKAGIAGVVAGTQIKMLKDTGDTMHASDGVNEFDIKKSQVTNDIDVAAAIRKRAAASTAAADAATAAQQAVFEKQQRDQIEFLRAHPLSGTGPGATPK